MILIDAEKKTVIEPIVDMKGGFRQLYDFDFMQTGGHIDGWQVDNNYNEIIIDRLNELENDEIFNDKYKLTCKKALAYAVGDGNHSLATAKTCYENLKKTMNREEYLKHPSRYALAEIVNLHDSALEFKPIHLSLIHI